MGAFLIGAMAFRLWHPSVKYIALNYFDFGLNTVLIVIIWFECRRINQRLDQLDEKVGENDLSSLSKHMIGIGYIGYLAICELTFIPLH
jgi:hypothetical protein